jgi:hypothetical protein
MHSGRQWFQEITGLSLQSTENYDGMLNYCFKHAIIHVYLHVMVITV